MCIYVYLQVSIPVIRISINDIILVYLGVSEKCDLRMPQAFKSQSPGRRAHHRGWIGIALTPLWINLYLISCNLGKASEPLRGVPSGRVGPVQNTSADAAARGHTIGSRLEGSDCSVQRRVSPKNAKLQHTIYTEDSSSPPRISLV